MCCVRIKKNKKKTGLQSWFQNSLSLNFPESGFSSEKYSDYWFTGSNPLWFYERMYVKCLINYKLRRNIWYCIYLLALIN